MRRDLKILLATTALAAVAEWGPALQDAVADMETFRLSEVDVRGTRYLSPQAVEDHLAVAPTASVWTSTEVWEDRLRDHPLIRDAVVSRRLPNGLRVEIEERIPIALAPTPTLEAVDAEGYRLPLDPALYHLDLPVIATDRVPPEGSVLFTEEVRALAAELDHLSAANAGFVRLVSSVRWDEDGGLVASWTEPRVEFLLPARTPPSRLREGMGALNNAMTRTPNDAPAAVDLRFADQVVVRRGRRAD